MKRKKIIILSILLLSIILIGILYSSKRTLSQYKNAVICGNILGVDYGSATDGPYHFIDKKTGEIIETCSFWKSVDTQSPCQPPEQWTCGPPSNYGG